MQRLPTDSPTRLLLCLWLALLMWGGSAVVRYANAEGAQLPAPTVWPTMWAAGVAVPREEGVHRLLVFVHPMCPCTVATFAELDAILTDNDTRVQCTAFFLERDDLGDDLDEDWRESTSRARAKSIDGLECLPDPGGLIASTFGAETSGQVLLYGPSGSLLYQGGITIARGHAGPNAGRARLSAALANKNSSLPAEGLVFGCPLFGESDALDAMPTSCCETTEQ